jgi:hypothetical protein
MKTEDMIYDQLKEISKDVKCIREDVSKNTADLEHHIKRTDLLEERAIMVNWKSVSVFLGIVGSIVGITYTIMRIVGI